MAIEPIKTQPVQQFRGPISQTSTPFRGPVSQTHTNPNMHVQQVGHGQVKVGGVAGDPTHNNASHLREKAASYNTGNPSAHGHKTGGNCFIQSHQSGNTAIGLGASNEAGVIEGMTPRKSGCGR